MNMFAVLKRVEHSFKILIGLAIGFAIIFSFFIQEELSMNIEILQHDIFRKKYFIERAFKLLIVHVGCYSCPFKNQ